MKKLCPFCQKEQNVKHAETIPKYVEKDTAIVYMCKTCTNYFIELVGKREIRWKYCKNCKTYRFLKQIRILESKTDVFEIHRCIVCGTYRAKKRKK